jgi:hypothetical protein
MDITYTESVHFTYALRTYKVRRHILRILCMHKFCEHIHLTTLYANVFQRARNIFKIYSSRFERKPACLQNLAIRRF